MSYQYFEQLLKMEGSTVYRVSKETGISASTFTDWKNGRSMPKADKLKKIADYFGVSLDYLMRGVEEGEKTEVRPVDYKAKNMLQVWNSFVSNLTGKQRKMMHLLYVLLVCVLVGVIYFFCYWAGYVVGEFAANIRDSLNG